MYKAERLMLRFQGIRSPNSLKILCWTYYQTDNSLRSNNLFDNIAQKLQRKGLLIPFHSRIRSFCFVQIACLHIKMRLLTLESYNFYIKVPKWVYLKYSTPDSKIYWSRLPVMLMATPGPFLSEWVIFPRTLPSGLVIPSMA